jgi:hypothetical protein
VHADPEASNRLRQAEFRARARELTPLQRKVPGFAYTALEEVLLDRVRVAERAYLEEVEHLRQSLLARLPEGDPGREEVEGAYTRLVVPAH